VGSGRAVKIAACATAAVTCLAVAVFAGGRARAEQTRHPTVAELSAAAATGVAQRWERTPAGSIFPESIRYTTDLMTKEKASRVAINPDDTCASALDGTLRGLAAKDGCVAGLRADYADQLLGSVYTVGVLAFPSAKRAASFYHKVPLSAYPAAGLNALAVAGTPAALFADAARQASAALLAGPYVVLAVAGYSDGRHAKRADERRNSVFGPASQLVAAVAAPLAKPVTVRCGGAEWACAATSEPVPPPRTPEQVRPDELVMLRQIGVPSAWRVTRGAGVTVAVLDTGVDRYAADLTDAVSSGPDYTAGADPAGYRPPMLHGTYIASLIAGHGSGPGDQLGVIGVAPMAKILSVRVILDDTEPGNPVYNGSNSRYVNAIGKGIYYAVAHGAQVINMSLGSEQPTAYMRAAVAYALAKDVVIVASAGNDGTNSGFAPYVYPAAFTGVIAVAAVTGAGQRASFSEQNAAVVLSAPGVDVIGDAPGGGFLDAAGTSPAAALVSGVVALIRSRYPKLSPALVEQALITAAARRPAGGYSTGTGFGEVNAATAVAAAGRLAAQRPVTGFSPAAHFAASRAQAAAGRIQVVHRNSASIAGYTAAAGGGALGCLVALGVGLALVRRPRPTAPEPRKLSAPYGPSDPLE